MNPENPLLMRFYRFVVIILYGHSCANLLIGQRVPLIEVQQWLGHSTISTTADLYAHLDFATKMNSAETIKKN